MKKLRFFSVILTLVGFLVLMSCSKLPNSKYEKVEFAFDGVEKSLKDTKLNSNKITNNKYDSNIKLLNAITNPDSYSEIERLYVESDSQGDKIDELEYNEPPMIQFQYLKAILKEIGSDFEFGTKYYSNISNSIYYDIETGAKKNNTETNYKWDYNFKLSLAINIDDNDLITCDVLFDISLRQGNIEHNMNWYVFMELDYDMTNETPNYKFNMMTDNKNLKGTYTLENDYVEVKDNKINEWRKFTLEADRKLVKDSNHPNFDSYINEGIEYSISHLKWYKNNNLRKLMNNQGDNKQIGANALFNAGMNSSDINGQAFQNKDGKENESIKKLYNEFANINGADILYSLVPDEDKEKENDKTQPAGIIIMLDDTNTFGTYNYIVKNVSMNELFTDTEAWKDQANENYIIPKLYFANKDQELLNRITDLTPFNYYIVKGNTETLVSNGSLIADIYEQFGSPEKVDIKLVHGDFIAYIKDVRFAESAYKKEDSTSADMKDVTEAGFNAFVGNNITINKISNNEFLIKGSTYDERSAYYDTVLSDGYFRNNSMGDNFAKVVNDKLYIVRFNDTDLELKILDDNPYEEWNSTKTTEFLDGISIPNINWSNIYVEYRENQDNTKGIQIWNINYTDLENYLETIKNNNPGFVYDTGYSFKLRVVDDTNNIYHEVVFDTVDNNGVVIYCNTYNILKSKITIDGKDYPAQIDYSNYSIEYTFETPYLPINTVITFSPISFEVKNILSNSTSDIATFSGLTITPTLYSYHKYKIYYADYDSDEKTLYLGVYDEGSIDEEQLRLVAIDNNNPSHKMEYDFTYDDQKNCFTTVNAMLDAGYTLKITKRKGESESYTFDAPGVTNGITTKDGIYNFIIYADNPNVVSFYDDGYYFDGKTFGGQQFALMKREFVDGDYVYTSIGTFSYENDKYVIEADLTVGITVVVYDQKNNIYYDEFNGSFIIRFKVDGITIASVVKEAGTYKLAIERLNPYTVVPYED